MTFNPFRSDDDDALDARLNAWATDQHDHPDQASDLADDAIAFHRWANTACQHDYAATGPAANVWDTVLARTAPPRKERTHTMSSLTATAQVYGRQATAEPVHSGSYVNIAATVLMVVGLAAGGWFAAMQLNNPGSPDPRLAAVTGTPAADSHTCDVEPMTVDEVIAIVENPLSAIGPDHWGTPAPGDKTDPSQLVQNQELLESSELDLFYKLQPVSPTAGPPDQETLLEAASVLDGYVACSVIGTFGQWWNYWEPTMLQSQILGAFPVYREKEAIRAYVEDLIEQPVTADMSWNVRPDEEIYNANLTTGHARIMTMQDYWFLDYDAAMWIGWTITSPDGTLLAEVDFEGTLMTGDDAHSPATSMLLVHSSSTDTWYVVRAYGVRG